jgi:hypothetical protein
MEKNFFIKINELDDSIENIERKFYYGTSGFRYDASLLNKVLK